MNAPKLSVLLAVHNGEPYLEAALESVLAQDFRDFELVVVDDGSRDGSAARVAALGDLRVRLHVNERNLGHTPSLNIGLRKCRGEYVARMDADDLCWPGRFAKQVAYLDAHPDVGILGGAYRVIDGADRPGSIVEQPADDESIRWLSMTKNPFHHPTVVLRRVVLAAAGAQFDERFGANQDYELWDRLLRLTRAANLTEPVLDYRIHGNNISVRRAEEQMRCGVEFSVRRTLAESGLAVPVRRMAGIYVHVHGSSPDLPISGCGSGEALDSLLDASEAFFAARGGGSAAARRLAAATAMRAWLVRRTGPGALRRLARIHRLHAGAGLGALAILAPQAAAAARARIGGRT
jgi:hypothetical protein